MIAQFILTILTVLGLLFAPYGLVATGSSAAPGPVVVSESALEGKWTSVSGVRDMTLTFGTDDEYGFMLSMSTACNGGTAEVSVEDQRLVAGPFTLTKMACRGLDGIEEARAVRLVSAHPVIRVSGDSLELVSGLNTTRFVRS